MAQAQVVLTAVDRTQVAINSAVRGMKSLERTAKVTAKAVNMAFGFFTGGVIIGAFGKIIEAAKKTEEGAKSVENLKKTLQDPVLLSAANAVSKTLVDGFVVAAGGVAAFARLVKQELVALGAVEASTTEDIVANLKRELAKLKSTAPTGISAAAGAGFATQVEGYASAETATRIAEIEAALKAIEKNAAMRAIYAGGSMSGRPGGTRLSIQRGFLEAQAIAEKNAADAAAKSLKKLNEEQAAFTARYRQMKDQLEDPDLFENAFEATDVQIANSVQSMLDNMNAADKLMEEFAKTAAQNIQSAFADFLFDPFENGLKGMLSGFLNVIRRMIAEAAASAILKSVFGAYQGKSGFMGAVANALFTRASGGPVSPGTPYLVGERGPELFVPGTSGGIMPNNRLGNMGSGVTVAPVYNIDARGATADLQNALPGILAENNRRIFDELDRRYGIGR
jgi:hypothetical protein